MTAQFSQCSSTASESLPQADCGPSVLRPPTQSGSDGWTVNGASFKIAQRRTSRSALRFGCTLEPLRTLLSCDDGLTVIEGVERGRSATCGITWPLLLTCWCNAMA